MILRGCHKINLFIINTLYTLYILAVFDNDTIFVRVRTMKKLKTIHYGNP